MIWVVVFPFPLCLPYQLTLGFWKVLNIDNNVGEGLQAVVSWEMFVLRQRG